VPPEAEETAKASVKVIAAQDKLLSRLISPEDEPVTFVGGG
jgi:hypothetical protein